ncbi:PhzF family phenazine biosynthesis protein [Paraburkholderia lacunae]|uniref:PhzF family phenazine biosynthesis protein n=1 Tax=Paraburkholderia lacunae TaxID=2211104 RepID=UPI0024499239|nr:PhzF family phenazine biosynthesis protein [Paraburkholderia lacunae]
MSKSDVATVKLEFFTPTRQIAHCGHATIATFSLLRELGRVNAGALTKETIDGCRNVLVDDHVVLMKQSSPTYRPIASGSDLAQKVARSMSLEV